MQLNQSKESLKKMKFSNKIPALLVLADGTVFKGNAAGKIGTTTGEICFNTGMTGYQEVFTDPSYYGQILIETNVHIGNYGISNQDAESEGIKIAGLVCKAFHPYYSRQNADYSVTDYFEKNNVVAIVDVDTRAVVRHIRSKGAMNAIISSVISDVATLKKMLANVPSMEGLELSSTVSTKTAYTSGIENSPKRVALLDLGIKQNTIRCLNQRGVYVKVFPYNTSFDVMEAFKPDGYLISNGPGDPAVMPDVVATVAEIVAADKPLFGICLGHQMLAESQGIKTYKMFNGHRGINHPVKNVITGHCEITSQNHGFAVIESDVMQSTKVEVTHINLNDNTIEGIRLKGKKAFSVQYHPESAPGPHDSRYLFDDFVASL
jgi:carbamoyl-phosphate synthase small subunit